MLDILTPWLPVIAGVAAAVAVVAAIGRGMLITYRHIRRRIINRRTGRIVATVIPLLDERLQGVDTAILNLRLELGETTKIVSEVKAIVSDGLQDDVTQIRKEQVRVADRIDRIYEHLIPK